MAMAITVSQALRVPSRNNACLGAPKTEQPQAEQHGQQQIRIRTEQGPHDDGVYRHG